MHGYRQRGRAWTRTRAAAILLFCAGCGSSQRFAKGSNLPSPVPVRAPEAYAAPPELHDTLTSRSIQVASLATRDVHEQIYAVQQSSSQSPGLLAFLSDDSASPPAQPPTPLPTAQGPHQGVELFDIEAHLEIEVAQVVPAKARVVAIVREYGGQVVNESLEDQASVAGAALSLRVPSERVHALLAKLAGLGRLRSQRLETTEISRKHNDAQVLLRNIELSLERYQQLLKQAQTVTEMTAIEAELDKLRTALDRVTADLEWMRDRVARSTVYVTLGTSQEDQEWQRTHSAKLHPGVRLDLVTDLSPKGAATTSAGAGVSVQFTRRFSADFDLLSRLGSAGGGGVDFFVASVGAELYSDFLGGGRRRWLNPYLGFRAGYARTNARNQLALGGTLGLDLYRSDTFSLELQSRCYALIGPRDGVHFAVQPALGANVAF